MHPLGAIALYSAATYLLDVVVRPSEVARTARTEARARGKPVLQVGAGTPGSSLRVALLGPTTRYADVNLDLAAKGPPGPGRVGYGDVHHLPYRDKTFGSVVASHVLEHVDDPVEALRELHRVADRVFVVWPSWWAPHTWLHPGHQWYRSSDGRLWRLWQ